MYWLGLSQYQQPNQYRPNQYSTLLIETALKLTELKDHPHLFHGVFHGCLETNLLGCHNTCAMSVEKNSLRSM